MKRIRIKLPTESSYITYDKNKEPIVLSKALFDLLLKEEKNPDAFALYCFYYYTAKWQHSEQIKATTGYVAEGLGWTKEHVRKAKGILIKLQLIEDIQLRTEEEKIIGHFIKIHFIWNEESRLLEIQRVDSPPPNALNHSNKKDFFTEFISLFPPKWRSNTTFQEVLKDFITHRREKQQKLTPLSCKRLATKLINFDLNTVINAFNNSIENGWIGVFPESESKPKSSNKPKFIKDPDQGRFDLCSDGLYRHCVSGQVYIP